MASSSPNSFAYFDIDLYKKDFNDTSLIANINEAIDHRIPADTFTALKNPNAMLVNLEECLASTYQDILYQAKQDKMANAKNRVKMEHLLFLIDL